MIDQDSLEAKFVRIGARLKLSDGDRPAQPASCRAARSGSTSRPTATASSSRSGAYRRPTPRSTSWTCSPPTATCC